MNQSTSALICIISCAFTEDFIWREGFTVKKSLEAMGLRQCAHFPGNNNLMPREGQSPAEATQQVCNTVTKSPLLPLSLRPSQTASYLFSFKKIIGGIHGCLLTHFILFYI